MTERDPDASKPPKRKGAPRGRTFRAPTNAGSGALAGSDSGSGSGSDSATEAQPPRLARDGTRRGIAAHRGKPALTPDVLQRILGHLREGQHYDTACHLEGVWPTSLDELANRRPDVAQRVAMARAHAEAEGLRQHRALAQAGERTGGTEWWLERSFPTHWGPAPTRSEVSGPGGGPQVIHHRLQVDAVQRLALSEGDDGT